MPHANREDVMARRARQRWMGVLARASVEELERHLPEPLPEGGYSLLRRPETGSVMLRGRAGGTGERFNLGEATLTRCTLRLADGTIGFGYVMGRRPRHAELAALFDALLQQPERRDSLMDSVIEPLARRQEERRQAITARAASSKVDFFTMVRESTAGDAGA
ncbi:phosphonate C-P lyase system protein PhnG [Fodinicurvata halophila]|uniref:Phosphonate C-P lyase system protein PhnG n=1 Tax=Fodinicurvata halophila TaxID=1419723 RepID=A0ABV8UMF8_9PROT